MENHINMAKVSLEPLTKETVAVISQWEYEAPYEAYSFKDHHDEYLLDESVWGVEQFCLTYNGILLGQVAASTKGTISGLAGQWHLSLPAKEMALPL